MTESKQKHKNKKKNLIILFCITGIFLMSLLAVQTSAIKAPSMQSQMTFVTIEGDCVNLTDNNYNKRLMDEYNVTLLNHMTHEEIVSFVLKYVAQSVNVTPGSYDIKIQKGNDILTVDNNGTGFFENDLIVLPTFQVIHNYTSNVKNYCPYLQALCLEDTEPDGYYADAPNRIENSDTYIPILAGVDKNVGLDGIEVYEYYESVNWLGLPETSERLVDSISWSPAIYTGTIPFFHLFDINKNLFDDSDDHDGVIKIKIKFLVVNNPFDNWEGPINLKLSSYDFPKFEDWTCGDTHLHTIYTHNVYEFGAPIYATKRAAESYGLDWFTVTDHSFDLDSNRWVSLVSDCNSASNYDFKCLIGEEISCEWDSLFCEPPVCDIYSHFLGYNISNRIFGDEWEDSACEPNVNCNTYNCEEINSIVEQNGGFGYIAHPSGTDYLFRQPWQNYSLSFTGLEIWNGPFDNDALKPGLEEWTNLLLNGSHVFIEGGSDAHGNFNENFGVVATCCYTPEFTKDEIFSAMKNGNCFMTNGPALKFEINGAKLGEEIDICYGDSINISAEWKSTPEFGEVNFLGYKQGNIGASDESPADPNTYYAFSGFSQSYTSSTSKDVTPYTTQDCYYRLYGETSTGKRVYTNPIWVNVHTLDSDGDGLCNYRDECPATYGVCRGCPLITCPSSYEPICSPSGEQHCQCSCSDATSYLSATTVYDETVTTCCLGDSYTERWYKIDVISSGDLYLKLYDFGSNDFNLELYNSSLSLIGQSELMPPEEITKFVTKGTYYIKVYQLSGEGEFKLYVDFDPEIYGCVGATEIFTCGETVTESCIFNADLNCTVDALTVISDDITIDCDGKTLNGTGLNAGIVVYTNNVTVKNCKVFNHSSGIVLWYSSNNRIYNNIVSSNSGRGIWLGYSSNNNIVDNIITENNDKGIYLQNSSDNTITHNTVSSNSDDGISLQHSSNDNVVINNDVNSNNWSGILLFDSLNNTITKNMVNSNKLYGIYVYSASNNSLTNNIVTLNKDYGVYIWGSLNNNLTENLMCENVLDIQGYSSNFGDENTCNTTENWNDSSKEGCSYSCIGTPDIKINKTLINYFSDTGVIEYNITVKNKDYKNAHDINIADLLPYGNYSVFDVNIGSDCDEYIGARLVKIGEPIGAKIGAKIGEPIGAKIGTPIGIPGCEDYSLYYPDQYNLSESPTLTYNLKYLSSFLPGSKCTINFKVNATHCPYTETNFTNTALASISNYNLTFNVTSTANINCSSKPDLTVTKLVATKEHPECGAIIETGFLIGENITFYTDIENLGELYASSLEASNVSLLVFEGSDLIYSDYRIINLKEIYKLYDLNFSWTPENTGIYNIKIKIDPEDSILELNKTNNELGMKLFVYHECDLNRDGIITHDYNDLMQGYKCFLGIKNCDNYYQNWDLIKQEYECFINPDN